MKRPRSSPACTRGVGAGVFESAGVVPSSRRRTWPTWTVRLGTWVAAARASGVVPCLRAMLSRVSPG
jgi:hypothetical protein